MFGVQIIFYSFASHLNIKMHSSRSRCHSTAASATFLAWVVAIARKSFAIVVSPIAVDSNQDQLLLVVSQHPVERADGDHFHVQVQHLELGEAVLARHLLHFCGHVCGHLQAAVAVDGGHVVVGGTHDDLPQAGHDVDGALDEVLNFFFEKIRENSKIR